MKAVLLAAGLGKRLYPITQSIPKPMIPIAGKPILEYVIKELADCGFDDICIVVGHEKNQIRQYFEKRHNDLKLSFITQDEYKGTAHAVLCAKEFVGDDAFLLYLSDTLIPFYLQNRLSEMKNSNDYISILSSQSFVNDSNSVGNIVVKDSLVKEISEKPDNPKSAWAWAGLAIFKDASIFEIIKNMKPSKHGEYDITEAMNLALQDNKTIRNYSCEKFIDCGTPKGLLDALGFILSNIHSNGIVNTCKTLEPVYVGKNCTFGKNVTIGPFVSVGDNVVMGDNAKINNSIVFSNTQIPSGAVISNSILSQGDKLSIDESLL